MQKETRRFFRWDTVIPMTLAAFSCILLFCNEIMPRTALAASVGALLLVAGVVRAVGFFLGEGTQVVRMLAGVVCVSVGVWALVTCTDFSRSILSLGLGICLILTAAAEVFDAVAARKKPLAVLVRSLLAAGYAATGALLVSENFSSVFPSVGAALITAGAILLVVCAEELFSLLKNGFFRAEVLSFRPAAQAMRKKDRSAQSDAHSKHNPGK